MILTFRAARSRGYFFARVLVLGALAAAFAPTSGGAASGDGAPHGFVYRITSKDAPGHALILYGTLHVGKDAGQGLDAATLALLSSAQRLALELDPRDSAAIARSLQTYAMYPAGDSLGAHVPAALEQHAIERSEALQLPRQRAEQMRPWMLANVFSIVTLNQRGYDPRKSSELLLTAEAAKDGISVVEIEGIEVQMRLLASASEATQVDALQQTLEQIDNGQLLKEAATLVKAWNESDGAAMDKMLSDLKAEPGLYPHFMAKDLLDVRNQSMTDVAIEDLALPGTTFFAVGSLHLFGASGVVAQLQKRGYQIEALSPVQLN